MVRLRMLVACAALLAWGMALAGCGTKVTTQGSMSDQIASADRDMSNWRPAPGPLP